MATGANVSQVHIQVEGCNTAPLSKVSQVHVQAEADDNSPRVAVSQFHVQAEVENWQLHVSQIYGQVEYDLAPNDVVSEVFGQVEYDLAANDAVSEAFAQVEYFSNADLPASPTGLSVVSGWSKNTLSWNSVAGAVSYNIYWSNTTGVTKENGTKITGVSSGYVHGDLDDGTPYYYIVSAVNEIGEGPACAEASGTPSGGLVQNVSALGGNKQVAVSWSALTGAVSYRVYWSLVPGVTKGTGTRVDCNDTVFVHSGLANGKRYYYVVTAVNSYGRETDESLEVYADTVAPVYDVPPTEARTSVALVILDLDFCIRNFSVSPCLATGTPCYNTWGTCKYIPAYSSTPKEYKFSSAYAIAAFDGCRPYVDGVKLLPTEIKTNFTVSGRVTVDFLDEPDEDVGIDPYWSQRSSHPGTYFKKLLARNKNYKGRRIRVYEGYAGMTEGDYVLRWVGKIENIVLSGSFVKLEAVDLLKDLAKIEVPPRLAIKLAVDLAQGQTAAVTLTTVAGLDGSNGYIRVDDEIIGYATADPVTQQLLTLNRGAFGTDAVAHGVNDKVQKCRYFPPTNPYDLLLSMLITDAAIEEEYIDSAAFEFYKAWPGSDVDFWTIVSEPMPLSRLYFEVVDLLDAKSWVAEDLKVTIRRNVANSPGQSLIKLTDADHIIHQSMKVDLNEKSRITRTLIYWHKSPTGKDDEVTSYSRLDVAVDSDAESASGYGEVIDKKMYCRWLDTTYQQEETVAQYVRNLAMRQTRRSRDAQALVSLELDTKDSEIKTGDFVQLDSDELLNPDGTPLSASTFQAVRREKKKSTIALTLQRIVSGTRICFICPNEDLETPPDPFPGYASASELEREYGFITENTGLMPNGDPGYIIW
mgnify:CR=1 FL=1